MTAWVHIIKLQPSLSSLLDWLPHSRVRDKQTNTRVLEMFVLKELVFAAAALVAVFGQEPETKELFVSRGKIILLNPFHKFKSPRTFTRYTPASAPTKTITELVVATPALSTLLAAVQAAGLADTLASEGPFTVFAPTNDAFAKIPSDVLNILLADKDALTAVLLRHVVPDAALKAQDVPHGTTSLKTAGGEEIEVTRNRYIKVKSSAGEASVIATDILATNGVVHLVNTVI